MNIGRILRNLIPGLIVTGLWRKPDKIIRGFVKFGNAVTRIISSSPESRRRRIQSKNLVWRHNL